MDRTIKLVKREELLRLLDFVFVLGKDQNTDGYAYAFNENGGMMSLFSGKGKTAYQAARLAAGSAATWFQDASNEEAIIGRETILEMKTELEQCFSESMARSEASEASGAMMLCQCENRTFHTVFYASGDVRAYLLTEEGLMQLTPDETEGVLSADSTALWSAERKLPLPGIIILATKKAYERYPDPMELEYMLVDNLCASQNIEGFKEMVRKEWSAAGTDDFTIAVCAFGYGNFLDMQRIYSNRKSNLYWNFLAKESNATPYEVDAMQQDYRKTYRFYLNQKEGRENE